MIDLQLLPKRNCCSSNEQRVLQKLFSKRKWISATCAKNVLVRALTLDELHSLREKTNVQSC